MEKVAQEELRMGIVSLHDKSEIEAFARRRPLAYPYELGDLDPFFWPYTVWFGLRDDEEHVQQIALLYTDMSIPVLLVTAPGPAAQVTAFVRSLLPLLPGSIYAHLSEPAVAAIGDWYHAESHGIYCKMGLTEPTRLGSVNAARAFRLTLGDQEEVEALYRASYPGHWFIPRMLETGFYYGVRQNGELAAVSGVHVVSREYSVAALGNITTHPDCRGRGLATIATAAVCQALDRAGVQHIGLNVNTENAAAIAVYERLGFTPVSVYGEYTLTLRR
jgi:ribosomal protein S18 acetylase RimI-like enzyme